MPGGWSARCWLWRVGGFALALLLLMPLRIALAVAGADARGLSARAVSGTLWSGTLMEARLGDIDLGTVRAGLSPFRLLIGEARINLRVVDATSAAPLQGALSQRIGGFGIVGMNGDVSMGQIFAPLPINGLAFTDLTVRFAGDMCMDAHGQVLARLNGGLDGVPGLAMPGSLSGVARCDAGMLVLPLISQAGTEVLIVHIKGDGRYRAELTIQVDDTALAQKLTMAGFVPEPKGYRLSVEGRF